MEGIEIHEVGPRDGFQSVKDYIPLETRIRIVKGLIDAGIRHIQLASFVSPRAIPQMREARELCEYWVERHGERNFYALVPNLRGAIGAWETGLRRISYVVSLSLSHNQANLGKTHEESLRELLKIRETYPEMVLYLDLATAFACPFEGMKGAEEALSFLKPYVEGGIETVNLCDTVGWGNPAQLRRTIQSLKEEYSSLDLSVHIHDTRNRGMVNTLAAIECGVHKVQSTLGAWGAVPSLRGPRGT